LFDDDDLAEFVRSEFADFVPGWQKLKQGLSKTDLGDIWLCSGTVEFMPTWKSRLSQGTSALADAALPTVLKICREHLLHGITDAHSLRSFHSRTRENNGVQRDYRDRSR
jgi:hypothetical protein